MQHLYFGSLEVAMRQNDLAISGRCWGITCNEMLAFIAEKTHPNAAVVNSRKLCGLDSTGRSCDNGDYDFSAKNLA